jgi:RimJ/RimL family protein N-acetyltransferase
LFDLRISTPDLRLQPMTEADLGPLADVLPADVEQDPAATRFDAGDERTVRGIVSHQNYWRSYGMWSPQAWSLNFVVSDAAGQIIGVQEMSAADFLTVRTVDTSSYLLPGVRGRGYGKQMRRAVLALAFGPLAALAAITSAWHDNQPSLGVSRALGYRPNGESLHPRRGGADVLTHLRLTRDEWLVRVAPDDIEITGFDACRPLFGLPGGDVQESPRRGLKPELSGEQYVFASVIGPMPGVPMFAAILEDEGLTLVLTRADADRAGLGYEYVAARITLRVDSTLDEVGLTASFSKVLADAGISCNVVAGVAHDHLFVPWERGEQAVELLRRL